MADEVVGEIVCSVVDKAIKEDRNKRQYGVLDLKIRNEKYPRKFSWFYHGDSQGKEVFAALEKGMVVNCIFTETEGQYDGKKVTYRNIKSISGLSEEQQQTLDELAEVEDEVGVEEFVDADKGDFSPTSRDDRMVRMNVLNRAVDIFVAGKCDQNKILGIAETFEKWVRGEIKG